MLPTFIIWGLSQYKPPKKNKQFRKIKSKISITYTLFNIDLYFFVLRKVMFCNLESTTDFSIISYFRGPRQVEAGSMFAQ